MCTCTSEIRLKIKYCCVHVDSLNSPIRSFAKFNAHQIFSLYSNLPVHFSRDTTVSIPVLLFCPARLLPEVSTHWNDVWSKHLWTVFISRPPGFRLYCDGRVALVYAIPLIFQIDGVGWNSYGHGMKTSVSPSNLVMSLGCKANVLKTTVQ